MSSNARYPSVFITHGGGPSFYMKDSPVKEIGPDSKLAEFLRGLVESVGKPKAVLIVSAHWEDKEKVLVNTNPSPALLFDYYGFPPHTYKLTYPAAGSSELGSRVLELLQQAGIASAADKSRDWDHGVFVPLKLILPDADVPIVQISLLSSLDPEKHIEIGRALAPLRDEGIMILGSGAATHNLREIFSPSKDTTWASSFVNWLTPTLDENTGQARSEKLVKWKQAPGAVRAHPREEHLIPLFVAVGAAEDGVGKVIFEELAQETLSLNCYRFD